MEHNSNDLFKLSKLPPEIQQHIATYLDAPALGFFAQSNKQVLKNLLPLLHHYQARFPLWLTAKGNSNYLTQAHQLFVCGSNNWGQLGLGDNMDRVTFTAMPWPEERGQIHQVIAGENHTVVLTKNNTLWVCGENYYGLLGLDDQLNRSTTFTAVPWPEERGQIQQVISGDIHTLVLTKDNRLWGCGSNHYGQLGLGNNELYKPFTKVEWPEERGTIQQVVAGASHTIVLTKDNRLWVCGDNHWGQLGLGDKVRRSTFTAVPWPAERGLIEQVIASGYHTLVLTKDNRLWVCGSNGNGELGLGDIEHRSTFTAVPWSDEQGRIQQVIAGVSHTILLTDNNRLWVCGYNDNGELGLGDHFNRISFTEVMWPEERGNIQQVIAGKNHTVVLTQANRLWVCGDNTFGQLGLWDKEVRYTFTPVEGLSEAMKQLFTLNNHLNQLIKFGISLTHAPRVQSNTLQSQYQSDEPEVQPPLKKIRL